jgi:NAD-dependent deacetylase
VNNPYENAAHAIRNARCVVALTGAGISVESGIPSFRGRDGIWTKYPIEEYAVIDAFLADPEKVWRFWFELGDSLKDCKPNPAHYALAELERMGRCHAVITQNIDNLHEEAGSTRVIEYHGNTRRMVCLDCGTTSALDLTSRGASAPRCPCGAVMKPDVVMFGEIPPENAVFESDRLARQCDVMLVVGTSATVYPAAEVPYLAKNHGAFIIEANIEETDFTRSITDAFLKGPAAQTLPRLVDYAKH